MTSNLCYLRCWTHFLMAVAPPVGQGTLPHRKNCSGMFKECDNELMVLTSKESWFLWSQSIRASLPEQVRSIEVAPSTPEVSKDPTPKPWCQTPQEIPQRWTVRASTGQSQVGSMMVPGGLALAHSMDAQGFPAEHCIETRRSILLFKLHISVK